MSFVRIPNHRGGIGRPRKPRRKPEWDDSVNDLNVHKSSADELQRRKTAVKSNNLDFVKADLLQRKIHKAKTANRTPGKGKNANALLREIFYNESQVTEALEESDRVMSVVKDLFGDDPMKFRGLPNVTVAPNVTGAGRLPDGSQLSGPSKLDLLSQTIMDKSALNEYSSDSQSEPEDSDSEMGNLNFQSVMDLGRFKRFLETEQGKAESAHIPNINWQIPYPQASGIGDGAQNKTPPNATPTSSPGNHAMNDTAKIARHRSVLAQGVAEDPPEAATIQDMHQALGDLETGICDYERQLGLPASTRPSAAPSVSSYTKALTGAVNRLSACLNQSVSRLQEEAARSQALENDMKPLKALFQALTADVLSSQEEVSSLQARLDHQGRHHQAQMAAIMDTLQKHGIAVPVVKMPALVENRVRPGTVVGSSDIRNSQTSQPAPTSLPADWVSVDQQSRQIPHLTPPLPQHMGVQRQEAGPLPQKTGHLPHQTGHLHQQTGPQQQQTGHPHHQMSPQLQQMAFTNIGPPPAYLLSPPKQTNSPRNMDTTAQSVNILHTRGEAVPQPHASFGSLGQSAFHPASAQSMNHSQVTSRPSQYQNHSQSLPVSGQSWEELSQHSIVSSVQSVLARAVCQSQPFSMGEAELQQALQAAVLNSQAGEATRLSQRPPDVRTSSQFQPLPQEQVTGEGLAALEHQLVALNRQHAEAESKLRNLMLHQSDLQESQDTGRLVSPPISPIPAASETESNVSAPSAVSRNPQVLGSFSRTSAQRGITISVPQVGLHFDSSPSPEAKR